MKATTIIHSLAVILLATLSVPAIAVPAAGDPTGTWRGSGTFEENCPPTPGPAGTFTDSADLTIDVFNYNSATGDFDVTVTAKIDEPTDPETISYSGSGYFFTPGSFNVSFSGTNEDGGFESWMGTGVASGTNEVTFTSLSGTESGGFNCTFTMLGNIVVKRDASIIIDPAEAPSNAVTSNAQTLATSVTTTVGFLGTRIQGALSGNQNAGFSRAGRGYMLEAPAS
ncbi:MAG: hypothetical protein OQL16_09310, partial [Gammaproteobacteria bacterium]|nr:hypothetical protein [Gammaproteobacteria bacterium]